MQDNWQDLIPFYIAGTLPEQEKRALEAYLRECGAPCEQELDEWRQIASATWQVAQVSVQTVPPLSARLRAEVARESPARQQGKIITPDGFHADDSIRPQTTAPVYPRPVSQSRRASNANRVPLTMAAVFVTVVIFGGLILSRMNLKSNEADVIELTDVNNSGTSVAYAAQQSLQTEATSGIIATPDGPRPSATFTITPTYVPTVTPVQPPATPNTQSLVQKLPTGSGACTVQNNTPGALTTYRNASFEAERVGLMQAGTQAQVMIATSDGWYELSYGNWVYGASLTVSGDCSQLWTPTPTQNGDNVRPTDVGLSDCSVLNNSNDYVALYQWPSFDSAVNGRLSPGEQVSIYLSNNEGWYQVFYAQWVNGADINLIGNCTQLWTPTATIPPMVTSTPLPPPSASNPIAVVNTSSGMVYAGPGTDFYFVESFAQNASLRIIATNGNNADLWYLVQVTDGRSGWIQASSVSVLPAGVNLQTAATVPAAATVTPTGFVPTPAGENWTHVSTVQEQGCGGTVGVQETIAVVIQHTADGSIIFSYPQTGASFVLTRVAPNTYSGIYGAAADVQVDLTFTSDTTYTATETITQASGCVVKTSWAGSKNN